MRIWEERHPGEWWILWKLGNLTAIDGDIVKSVAVAWLFKEYERWVFRPRLTGNVALFYNAVLFVRICWPFGLFWMLRWSAVGTRAYWQDGAGMEAQRAAGSAVPDSG